MTSRLPLPQRTPELLETRLTEVQPTWTASLVSCGCCRTVWCRWSAGWAPPGTGSTAAVAAAAACSATGWRRDPGCSSGCHSWSLEEQDRRKSVSAFLYAVLHRHVNTPCSHRLQHVQWGSVTLQLFYRRTDAFSWNKVSLERGCAKQGHTVWFGLPDGSCKKEESMKKISYDLLFMLYSIFCEIKMLYKYGRSPFFHNPSTACGKSS